MNKERVNDWLIPAKNALEHKDFGIVSNGTIPKSFRGYISTFGAAVIMGSLPTAVAFFSEKGGAENDRPKLLQQMWFVITGKEETPKDILNYVCKNNTYELQEQFADASVAIKLAMNFFELKKDKGGNE